jgi:LPXTG-site transpeptidase (sortase) family protein
MSTSSGGGSTALSMDKDAFGERVQALLELRDEINENGECEVKVKESTSPSIDEYKKQYGGTGDLRGNGYFISMDDLIEGEYLSEFKSSRKNHVCYKYEGNIPSIDVNYPILSETSDKLLKVSVCKFWGCNPNEVGNLCIAGHNYRNSKFFSKVLKLTVGDIIEITDLGDRTLKYSVYDKFTVDPTDVSCTSQLTNGKKIVTLITCTNDSKQRVVVKAKEI